jgi:hypothetical protein
LTETGKIITLYLSEFDYFGKGSRKAQKDPAAFLLVFSFRSINRERFEVW